MIALAPTIIVQTRELAESLDLSELPINSDDPQAWLLFRDDAGLALRRHDGVRVAPEFVSGRSAARAREAGLAAQPLARALGVSRLAARHGSVTLLDATAGFGVDAWQAAALGATVTMIERHPVVHALLQDALARAGSSKDDRITTLVARITLHRDEALSQLARLADKPAEARPMLVYLDPMYPARQRRARSRKGIESLHALIPPGDDPGLLDAGLAAATERVIVKRPAGAPVLANSHGLKPDPVLSPNTRWDRYLALHRTHS